MRLIGLAVALTFSLTLAPLTSEAQQAASLPRIGWLGTSSLSDPRVPPNIQAFRQGLRELGYVEGQNIAIEFRWAEGKYDRLPGLAAELVRLKVSIIVAASSNAIQVAKQATDTIPIVMASVGDPVAAGFVASLARPGGNITGISNMEPDLVGKQLELLKEVLPKVSRVAVLGNPDNPATAAMRRQAQDAARALGVRLQPLDARDPSEIDRAFAATSTERAGAVIVQSDTVLVGHRTRIADHALRRRLPTVFAVSQFAEAGGLLSYGPSLADGFRRAALYVDKILKGAKPADLPIAQPTKFELVVNLKTAKAAVERRLTAAAVNRPLALLRHLLRLAHEEWEAIENVPRIRLEKEPQGRLRWLTQEEITRLLGAAAKSRNKELRAAIIVALNTGLRRGELLGLAWDRVDLSRGVIRLEMTKSGRRREVPMNDDSYRALVGLGPKAAGRVFKTRYIQTAYTNAVEAAKLDDVNFHTLRHTFASWAVMRGVTLKELQELLGHASLAMTMRYAHLAPEHLRMAVSRLEGLTSSEPASASAQASAQEAVKTMGALQNSL